MDLEPAIAATIHSATPGSGPGPGADPNEISIAGTVEQHPRSSDALADSNLRFPTRLIDTRFWLAAIAESSDDAIVGKDLNGVVKTWNPAAQQMFGFTADEMIGRSITRIIPSDRLDEEVSILARMRRNERIIHFETERKRKDGRHFPVSLTVSPIRDEQNRIIGISKIVRDLTERDMREAKLRTANAELERLARHLTKARDSAEQATQAKSRFLAGVSHELRTPLHGILGYAELLHVDGGLTPTQSARVEAMRTAGQHLLRMINSVLDLSEIETQRVGIQLAECEIQPIGAACIDLVRPVAESKGLALSLAVTPGTRRQVVTDATRLRQVLFNLLGNAVKFTSQGAVELRLRNLPDGSALRIEVTDTGPGISADQRGRLFQDFERLDRASTIEGAGFGLGLSARLAALMGGRLGHDDNPGGGSVFWLDLPVNNAASSVPTSAPAADDLDSGLTQTGTLAVLVVDDIPLNCDVAGSFLRAAGHNVTCVEGGEEAIVAVAGTDFDVVLMDVRMPEMDGLEATRRIRALDGARGQVPIVALTAQAFTDQVAKCHEAGMDSHLAKPFTQDTLISTVVRAVRVGRLHSVIGSPVPTLAASAAPSMIGADLPVVEPRAFERTAALLSSCTVAKYLREIFARGEVLLRGLHEPEALTRDRNELTKAAHTLAGSVSMFGFERLAAVGLRFERAAQSEATDLPALAEALRAAVEATLPEIRARLPREEAA
jgi:two-component system sensor histidine kinase/response regulator